MKKYQAPNKKIAVLRQPHGFKTISEMVNICAEKYSDKTAYEIPRNSQIIKYSFGDVLNLVSRLAKYLRDNDISKGDKIAIIGDNSPEWAISFFAISWIGAVAVPLDARAHVDSHKLALSHSKSKAVITSNSYYDSINSLKSQVPSLKTVIQMEELDGIKNKYSTGITPVQIKNLFLLYLLHYWDSTY